MQVTVPYKPYFYVACQDKSEREVGAYLMKKFSGGVYRALELPDARKKLWLADARQKGRMHVWEAYEAKRKAPK